MVGTFIPSSCDSKPAQPLPPLDCCCRVDGVQVRCSLRQLHGLNARFAQTISNRFVCQHMAQIGQCSMDAAITPGSILLPTAGGTARRRR